MKRLLLLSALVLWLPLAAQAEMTLTSPDFVDDGTLPMAQVYNGFGCTGGNKSPALAWTGAPDGAKAMAITVYDPDAPTGSGWWHWVAFNLPVAASGRLEEGVVLPPEAVQSVTDFGTTGYGGPCPPLGDAPHRYIFTLYALKDLVPLDAKASGAMVGYYLNQLAVARATLTGRYGREK